MFPAMIRLDQGQGGRRTAVIYTLIATAKLNNVDAQAWLCRIIRPSASTSLCPGSGCRRPLKRLDRPICPSPPAHPMGFTGCVPMIGHHLMEPHQQLKVRASFVASDRTYGATAQQLEHR
jgi:hypothetical protein